MGPGGPLVRFDQSSPSSFSVPGRGEATAIVAGERRLPAGSRGSGWIRETEAVLPVVAGSPEVEGVAGGELRGGGGFGEQSDFGANVVPDQNQVGGWVPGGEEVFLAKSVGRERPWWRWESWGHGGGRCCRRWGRRPPQVDWLQWGD